MKLISSYDRQWAMSSIDQNAAQILSGNSEQLRSNYLGDKLLFKLTLCLAVVFFAESLTMV